MAKTKDLEVLLTDHGAGLHEHISGTHAGGGAVDIKKLKARKHRADYKSYMKDSSRFDRTHMGDPGHDSLIMKEDDEVKIFYEKEFWFAVTRDPEIEEEGGDNNPFESRNSGGWTPMVAPEKATDTGAEIGDPKKWKAGPYKMLAKGKTQKFFKFIVWTVDGKVLDPDIVFDDL